MAENKKDSFTFSDKIKNSKPAFNPFSKRASSKIGANGKPKKTIFERTKRDAPFFVAAAAALLMLPFLYKYSGNIEDGGMLVPPGSEDTIFDPERFGFDPSVEDPTGQIAQYTGRDSFDLIKGWGSDEEPAADDSEVVDWRVQDGLDDNWNSTPSAPARSYAPAATRAAFQRTPTKINELGSASLNLRGGGGSIGRFGGANLKAAARQDSSGGPRQGIKPVSLQPLRAADSPSRSYFGQGGAAQARASRDAMGKSNALQALSDAMFDPVRAGGVRGGGLGSGAFGTPGGGAQINHTLDYKGITPWWWDMMKERSQKAWEWKYFLWRKNLVEPLVRALADLAVGFGCCLVSGSDDCSMGNFLGMKAGGGQAAKCCGMKESEWFNKDYPFTEQGCKGFYKSLRADNPEACPEEWEAARTAGRDLGFFGVRVDCLSNGIFGSSAGRNGPAQLKDRFNCEAVDTTHNFELQTAGKASKWHTYHLVVAKNYAPFEGGRNLCDAPLINYNKQSGSGIGNNEAKRGEREIKEVRTASRSSQGDSERGMGLVKENMNDGCVVYVAEGDVFDWNNFQVQVKNLLRQMYTDKTQAEYDKAFANMRLYFIEGLALKDKLSKNSWKWRKTENKFGPPNLEFSNIVEVNGVEVKGMPIARLPMTYVDFETNFILRKGNSSEETDKFKDKKRRYADVTVGVDRSSRTSLASDGKENAIRMQCPFSDFQIKAVTIEEPSVLEGVLTFNPNVYGQNAEGLKTRMMVYNKNHQLLFQADDSSIQRGPGQDGKVALTYTLTPDNRQVIDTDPNASEIDVMWVATNQDGKESQDNTGYAPLPPEPTVNPTPETPEPPTVDPGSESIYANATTFAFRLSHIPGIVSSRRQLTQAQIDIPASDAQDAKKSEDALRRATEEAMQNIETNSNVLGENALVWERAQHMQCLASAGAENFEIQSQEAKAYMDMIAQTYNKQYPKLPQIANPRRYPSLANLVDAMHIAQEIGNGQVPKAAVCQMGLLIGTVSKDRSIKSQYQGRNGYTNPFGAFASYIGWDAMYYPTQNSDDSLLPNGLNPRFNRGYTDNAYHWGGYVYSAGPKSVFKREMQSRQKDGRFPLADLTRDAKLQEAPGSQKVINANRKKYWDELYGPIWENGCDMYYDGTMSVEDAIAYLEMVCQNGLYSKPKGNGYQTGYAGRSGGAYGGRATETEVATATAE